MMFTSVMFASAAALVVHHVPRSWGSRTGRRLSQHRRNALLQAVGSVNGTDEGLRNVARTQLVGALSMAVVAVIVVGAAPTAVNVLAGAFLVASGWQVPLVLARSKEKARRLSVDLELSDALGELVMGVEAGLSLEAVIGQYGQRRKSALAREFALVLDRITVGVPRSTAFVQMRERTPTPGVAMFVSAVQQNQKLGTPLAGVLRQQGETARRRRRQSVEEHAAKLSLKMIFPTVFCILPTLLVVIVGPAIVRLVDSFPG